MDDDLESIFGSRNLSFSLLGIETVLLTLVAYGMVGRNLSFSLLGIETKSSRFTIASFLCRNLSFSLLGIETVGLIMLSVPRRVEIYLSPY